MATYSLKKSYRLKDLEEINKKVMNMKMKEDNESTKTTIGDANEQLQELKNKMDGK